MSLIPSASQTVGPFFNFALTTNPSLGILAREGAEGERIRLAFRVVDGDGVPTPGDSMIELWQADAQGRYAHALDPRAGEADPELLRLRPPGDRCERRVRLRDRQARAAFPTARRNAGAAHQRHRPGARAAETSCTRASTSPASRQRATIRCWRWCPKNGAPRCWRGPSAGQPDTWSIEIRLQGEAETVFFDV